MSKHSPLIYPGKINIDAKGLHLSDKNPDSTSSLLISWSSILRWEHNHYKNSNNIFSIHIAGLVFPDVPNDSEVLEATHRTHSFKTNGFSHDVSLDICLLAIVVEDQLHSNSLITKFQEFAWCSQKKRGEADNIFCVRRLLSPLYKFIFVSSAFFRACNKLFESLICTFYSYS